MRGLAASAAFAVALLALTACTAPAPSPTGAPTSSSDFVGRWVDPVDDGLFVIINRGGHAGANDGCRGATGSWFQVSAGVLRLRLTADPRAYLCLPAETEWIHADTSFVAIQADTLTLFDGDGAIISILKRAAA